METDAAGTAFQITSITRSGNNITITFPGLLGEKYRLERKVQPTDAWQPVGNDLVATSTAPQQMSDNAGATPGHAFYYVLVSSRRAGGRFALPRALRVGSQRVVARVHRFITAADSECVLSQKNRHLDIRARGYKRNSNVEEPQPTAAATIPQFTIG